MHSGLNRRGFIERKCEHWNWYHKSNLPKASPVLTQSTEHHTQNKSEGIQEKLTKVASTHTQQRLLDNKISISEKCVDGLDEAAKGLMCATVSTGVAKMVSQSAILAFYDAAADGYQKLYDIIWTETVSSAQSEAE